MHPTVDSPPPYLGYPVESSGQQGRRSGIVFRVSTDYRPFSARSAISYRLRYRIRSRTCTFSYGPPANRDIGCSRHVQRSRTTLSQNRGRALSFPRNPGKLSVSPFSRASRAIFGEGDPTPSNGRLFGRPLDGVGFSRHQGGLYKKISYGRTSTGVTDISYFVSFQVIYKPEAFDRTSVKVQIINYKLLLTT